MDFVAFPSWWTVTLNDGGTLRIFADSVEQTADTLGFDALVDASEHEQAAFKVVNTTPSNPRRVVVRLAEVPAASVRDWEG
jgi:hypothetical protein